MFDSAFNITRVLSLNFLFLFSLASCTPPSIPIRVTDVTSSYPPVVGKTVDLHVELTSETDEPNVLVFISYPPPIYSTDQEYRWELSLKKDEPVTLSTEMCVLEGGAWVINVSIVAYFDDGLEDFGDREVIGVVSKVDNAQLLLQKDIYLFSPQLTEEADEFDKRVEPSDCTKP